LLQELTSGALGNGEALFTARIIEFLKDVSLLLLLTLQDLEKYFG
jgi:hypothetical protein